MGLQAIWVLHLVIHTQSLNNIILLQSSYKLRNLHVHIWTHDSLVISGKTRDKSCEKKAVSYLGVYNKQILKGFL